MDYKNSSQKTKTALDLTLEQLHKKCSMHRKELGLGKWCWCFYCKNKFDPSSIKEWVDGGQTAICPLCGIDSVLGEKCGTKLTKKLIVQMYNMWFGRCTSYRFDKDDNIIEEIDYDEKGNIIAIRTPNEKTDR